MNKEELDKKLRTIADEYWPTEPKREAPELVDRIRNAVIVACVSIACDYAQEATKDAEATDDDIDRGAAFGAATVGTLIGDLSTAKVESAVAE